MTFRDIFKSGFLESVTEFSVVDVMLGLLFSMIIGLFIFVVYKKTFAGVMYSSGFAMTLIGLSLVTTLVIMAVTSNVIGAGMIPLAVTGSAFIGVILLLFANRKVHDNPYILIFHCNTQEDEKEALRLLEESVRRYAVKSKTVNKEGIELTAELRLKDKSVSFVNRMQDISGVFSATLVSYNGEYMS